MDRSGSSTSNGNGIKLDAIGVSRVEGNGHISSNDQSLGNSVCLSNDVVGGQDVSVQSRNSVEGSNS